MSGPNRSMMIAMMRRAVAFLPVLLIVFALAACGSDDEVGDGTGTTAVNGSDSTDGKAASSSTGTSDEALAASTVTVFFVRDEAVAAAAAEAEPPALAKAAIEALLDGPDELERSIGMTTAIPEGTELLGIDIEGGTATVDLSEEFTAGGGSLSMQLRVAQVVYTLSAFDTVKEVDIRIEGRNVDGLGGEGVPAVDLTPEGFRDVTPQILVTAPLPGQEVRAPVATSGISNTFEATVSYELTAPDGTVLDDGFTTATAGTGTWGTFQFSVEPPAGTGGRAIITAYQDDMESGGRQDVYQVPVTLLPR